MSSSPAWSLDDLRAHVRAFIHERDWSRFHSPRNLSMSIAIEAAELMECFQWRTGGEIDDTLQHNGAAEAIDELADVLIYCLAMADALEIDDLAVAVLNKLGKSGEKYPADKFKGRFR